VRVEWRGVRDVGRGVWGEGLPERLHGVKVLVRIVLGEKVRIVVGQQVRIVPVCWVTVQGLSCWLWPWEFEVWVEGALRVHTAESFLCVGLRFRV